MALSHKRMTESKLIEEYGVSPYATTEKCDSCGKSFDPEALVRTVDGPVCFGCIVEYGRE